MIRKFIGFLLTFGSLVSIYLFEHSAVIEGFKFLHWPALTLTGVGPFGLVLICTDGDRLRRLLKLFRQSVQRKTAQVDSELAFLQEASRDYYEKGAASLDAAAVKFENGLTRDLLTKLALKIPVADVRQMLERERTKIENGIKGSLNAAQLGVRLTPSVGMLGTILGMVQLLGSLKEPGQIGSSMSVALLTTFYGLFFSLVLWTPLEQKLSRLLALEEQSHDQCEAWLELLEKRKPAEYLEVSPVPTTLKVVRK